MADGPSDEQPKVGLTERKMLGALTQQDRTNPLLGFDLYESQIVDEVFADGVSQATIGPFTTRLTFYRVDNTVQETRSLVEQRRPVLNVVMPTPALLNFVNFFLRQLSASGESFTGAIEAFKNNIDSLSKEQVEAALLRASTSQESNHD